MTGSILGVYYATIVIASPILAVFMTKIGQANMLQVSKTQGNILKLKIYFSQNPEMRLSLSGNVICNG